MPPIANIRRSRSFVVPATNPGMNHRSRTQVANDAAGSYYCSLDEPHADTSKEPTMEDATFWLLLTTLFSTLVALFVKLASLGFHWILWIAWASVCLWAINWKKARHVLATGGWAP